MSKFWKEITPFIQEEQINGVNMKIYKDRPLSINQTLVESAKKFPNKVALVHGEERVTYRQLKDQVDCAASQLYHQYGVRKGDRVALLMMNGIPFVVGVYAALKIGAIAVPLNTKLKTQELEYMLINSGATTLIANLEWWPNIEPILNKLPLQNIFITTENNVPKQTLPFNKLVDEKVDGEIEVEIDEHDSAVIMYTSGTTGRPKGAEISHFNLIHTALNYKYCFNLTSKDSTIIAVPIFHITGLAAQLFLTIFLGGKVVLMPMFKAKEYLEIIESERITNISGAPTVFIMLFQVPGYRDYDVSSVRVSGFGGAPMPGETLRQLKDWIPNIELHNTYGLTETTSPAVSMPNEYQLERVSSVGVPVPTIDIRIVNPENNREVSPGEVGELQFKGPMVIRKYWNNEEATKKAIKDGWFATGDLGSMDEDGFVTIKDRIKDMINRGGEKVFSVEVEDVLYANQKIMEAAIVGVPDKQYGEVVKACVVPRKGKIITEEEVKEWVRDRLAKYKVPKYVEIMDVLPRNPNGKVLKTQLRYIPSQISSDL